MGTRSHALFSRLYHDLSSQISPLSLDRIKRGEAFWPGMTFKDRAAASIVSSLLKKEEGSLNEETKAKALSKFLSINDTCATWSLPADYQPCDDYLLGEVKSLIYRFWNKCQSVDESRVLVPIVDHPYDLLRNGEVGPGSAIGSLGGDFFTKLFSSRMAVTNRGLYEIYKRYIRSFPEWNNAELTRIQSYGEPEVVEGNRLDFVPKNDDISRSICVEPSLNMFYQLGLGKVLTSRLKEHWGIDLEFQQFKNRELARVGSWNGSFSTIDLSSASDSISLKMLEWLLPTDFYRWLLRLRSPTSRLPNGRRLELHMISTMGNGFTFPLQTIIFTSIVLSAFRMDGLEPIYPFGEREGNFGVNGDDIVVPTRITAKVLRLLKLLGFTPNADKTFVEGPFRESCGGDYFNGRNLRGVYIKKLRGPHDYYSVINQLNLFSTRTGLLLSSLVQHLLSKVRRLLPVPIWENDSSGIKMPLSVASRWLRYCPEHQSILYSALIPQPPPLIRICDSTLRVPRGFKPREYNPSGLFISLLQGSVSPEGIPLKPKESLYRTRSRIACNWDTPLVSDIRTIQRYAGWFVFRRWESATYLNLFG